MLKEYKVESIAEFYSQVKDDILGGKVISPRGNETIEIIAPQILLTNPRNRIAYHEDRKFSSMYAFVESLLLFDNTNKLKYFSKYNSNIHNYSDDGKHLYGSYGLRIADYIPQIIDKLSKDNSSRQIVFPILRIEDVIKDTKDIPCTLNLQLLVRDGKLNMITNMRSNDIMWGLPYDIFIFTVFQEIIANTLDLELGWYLHRPVSLHLYDIHYNLFEKVANNFKNVEIDLSDFKYENWIALKDLYKTFVDKEMFGNLFVYIYKDLISSRIKEAK